MNRIKERNILIECCQIITYTISIEKDDFIRCEMQITLDNVKDLIEEKEKYI